MKRVTVNLSTVLAVLTFVFVVLIGLTAALVEERSKDIVRLTVWDDELLPTVRTLQGVTGKVAYAYPVDKEEKHWRIVIDNRSETV